MRNCRGRKNLSNPTEDGKLSEVMQAKKLFKIADKQIKKTRGKKNLFAEVFQQTIFKTLPSQSDGTK